MARHWPGLSADHQFCSFPTNEPLTWSRNGWLMVCVLLVLPADPAVTVAISTPVQLFMAWRIKVLTGSNLAAIGISVLSVVACGGGLATSVCVALEPDFRKFSEFAAAPSTWLVTSAVCDVVIAVLLFYALSKKKSGFAHMDDYITRIMLITVQTGTLTAVAALADTIVLISIKLKMVPNLISRRFFSWDLSLSRLYTNTLLSSLNARNSWYNPNGPRQGSNVLFATSEPNNIASRGNIRMKPNDIELGDFKSPPDFQVPSQQQQKFTSFVPSANSDGMQSYGHSKRTYDGVRVTNEVTISHEILGPSPINGTKSIDFLYPKFQAAYEQVIKNIVHGNRH
ncbi:hypothetical protein C8J56DRAFT_889414 [Mycena floridula]|nr:hypothetical protein C8J56DRAFT_889414 [Mycena floridula]